MTQRLTNTIQIFFKGEISAFESIIPHNLHRNVGCCVKMCYGWYICCSSCCHFCRSCGWHPVQAVVSVGIVVGSPVELVVGMSVGALIVIPVDIVVGIPVGEVIGVSVGDVASW
jgi:hypothetical protein